MAIGILGPTTPKTPTEFIKSTIQTPTFGAGGTAATVFKSITKTSGIKLGSAILGVGGGLILGGLLTGGGSQEQKQAAAQDLKQKAEQRQAANLRARMRDFQAKAALVAKGKAEITTTVTPTITPTYDVRAGGDVDIGGVTETIITTDISSVTQGLTSAQVGQLLASKQEAAQIQIQLPAISQTQEAQQGGGGTNWVLLAAMGLAAIFLLGKWRKKRAG